MKRFAPVVYVVIVAVAIGPWLVWWSSLPDPVASHWDLHGNADGHLAPIALLLTLGGVASVLAVSAAASARLSSALPRPFSAAPVLAFVGGVLAMTSLSAVVANHDAAEWESASLSLVWIIAALVFGAAAALVVGAAMPRPVAAAPTASTSRTTLAVGPTERVAWVGGSSATWMLVLATGLGIAGLALVVLAPAPAGVILLVSALAVAAFSSVHVVVGAHGVRVSTPLGWPRLTLPLARIEAAEAIAVRPTEWGGWGYRGSLRLFRRAAWVVRGGEGVKLTLRDGKVFVVTVDGADEAASTVNALSVR